MGSNFFMAPLSAAFRLGDNFRFPATLLVQCKHHQQHLQYECDSSLSHLPAPALQDSLAQWQ